MWYLQTDNEGIGICFQYLTIAINEMYKINIMKRIPYLY